MYTYPVQTTLDLLYRGPSCTTLMSRDILLETPLEQCHELFLSQKKHGTFVLKSGNPKGMLAFHIFKNHLFPIGFP